MNGVRLTWPLVSLKASGATLTITTLFGGNYTLRRGDVIALKRRWRYFWPGLQVEHTRAALPKDLYFMPLYRPRLVRDLLQLGYRVT